MRQQIIPATAEIIILQEIATVSISYLDQSATVGVVDGALVDGVFIPDLKTVRYTDLGHDGFLELTKASAEKAKGEFLRDDVFAVLDKIKSGSLNKKND